MSNSEIKCLDKGFVRLVDHMGNDAAIVQKARVSYGEGTKKVSDDASLIRYLIRNLHTSPLEGVVFKFHIKAPIFVFRQWHRHRMWSYNEISGRYSEMPDEFYVPEESKVTTQNPDNKQGGTDEMLTLSTCKNPEDFIDVESIDPADCEDWFSFSEMFKREQEDTRKSYEKYLKTGMRKELARINLPLSQYSEMYATVDLHNLFHFLKLRQDRHAQYEIRVYADALLECIRPYVPVAVSAYEDYIKNSVRFSAKELEILKTYVITPELTERLENDIISISSLLPNKREQKEFIDKLKNISKVGGNNDTEKNSDNDS